MFSHMPEQASAGLQKAVQLVQKKDATVTRGADSGSSSFYCGGAAAHTYDAAASKPHHAQRYAPYNLVNSHSAQQRHISVMAEPPASQHRQLLLQLAISVANSSLEATLQHFADACKAQPGSPAALASLDAAESAMCQTNRMTSIASLLAKRCLQQQQQQHGMPLNPMSCTTTTAPLQQALAMAIGASGGGPITGFSARDLAAIAVARQQLLQQAEDVEEGEEVSSTPSASSSVDGLF